jgi:sulfur-carrier protein
MRDGGNLLEVTVMLPPSLVRLFPGSMPRVALRAGNVAEMIDALDARWPGMRDRLCDSTPGIRRHLNIFIAGKRARLETPLSPGNEVFIMTAMSGG